MSDCPICGASKAANCDCPSEAIAAVEKASDLEAELALVTEERDSLRLQVDSMRKVVLAAQDLRRTHAGLPMIHIRDRVRIMDEKADALCDAIAQYEVEAAAGSYACEDETCKWVSSPDSQPAMEGDARKCPRCGGAVTYVDRIG